MTILLILITLFITTPTAYADEIKPLYQLPEKITSTTIEDENDVYFEELTDYDFEYLDGFYGHGMVSKFDIEVENGTYCLNSIFGLVEVFKFFEGYGA